MIWFYIITIIILLYIAIIDYETEEIPHSFTLILLALGIISVCINHENWILPVVLAVTTFVLYAILFFITGKIGGGDVKILSISLLFLPTIEYIFNYAIFFAIVMMIGIFLMTLKKKNSLRLGPYMSLGLILTFTMQITNNILLCVLVAIVVVLFIKTTDIIYFQRRRNSVNEKLY